MDRVLSAQCIAAATALISCLLSVYAEAKLCDITCTRVQKMKDVGYDNLLSPLYVDIGKCESNFTLENDCEIPSEEDSFRMCQTRAYERLQYHNRDGPQTETVIRSCYRPNHKRLNCVRKPSYVHLFAGSKYHERVDVGQCVGQCQQTGSSVECLATRNITQAFEGPNGFVTIEITKECSCANTSCYRADFFESFTTSNTSNSEKLINVGKCVGTCSGVLLPPTCYPSPQNCIWPRPPRPSYCVPTRSSAEEFENKDGNQKQAIVIETCGCSSG